ncbi:MAG: acyl-CoA dehydratase activase-related protein [Treponema sp.]|jgi:predicted nucleotide-binding protein (sugar kinase/HSP70/actin superfamily)|nr:acyl-CoA dehydratase activase-related protein [Treponema sp.]
MSGLQFAKIGLPRSFYYYQYPSLWESFFAALGIETVLSPPSRAETIAAAAPFTESEHCLAHKIFDGQLLFLADKAEALFIPRLISMTRRHICCAKFGALPDASRALLVSPAIGITVPVLSPEINENKTPLYKTLASFAAVLGAGKKAAGAAAESALGAMEQAWRRKIRANEALPETGRFLLLGHPYTLEDSFIAGAIKDKLANMALAVEVMTFEPSPLSPSSIRWCTFSKMYRKLRDLDTARYRGVIQISTFNCGPDSIFTDIFRRICVKRDLPFLALTQDEHTGFAGIETRLEAFADSLEWKP